MKPTKDAFPHAGLYQDGEFVVRNPSSGMTLRDWYAGQALVGILTNNDVIPNPDAYARMCFNIADAMIKAGETT